MQGTLLGTTDLAGIIGRRYTIKNLINGRRATVKKTSDNTLVICAGVDVYEVQL